MVELGECASRRRSRPRPQAPSQARHVVRLLHGVRIVLGRVSAGILALALAGGGMPPTIQAQTANPPAFAREGVRDEPDPAPLYLFLNRPIDPESLRDELDRPDFVLLRSEVYARLRAARERASGEPAPMVVEAVALGGRVAADVALLTASFQVRLRDDAPMWVPLRLAGVVPRRAAEGGHDRPLRADAEGGWEVELAGVGGHSIEVEFVVPVRSDNDGRSLEVPIPSAASTRLDLEMPPGTRMIQTGQGPTLSNLAGSGGRFQVSLTPRDRVIVRWRSADDSEISGPPLLNAQGEITLEVERGSVRSRSTWAVRCERGSVQELTFHLPTTGEQVDSVEVEDLALPPEGRDGIEDGRLRIVLPQPLNRGDVVRIGLSTRREVPTGPTRFVARGYPLAGAVSQSGIVAIVQGQDLWVSASPVAGLRAIDPRKELPDSLRARPATVAAFRFSEQPFELSIQRDPSPPLLSAQARHTVNVERDGARLETELDCRVVRGKLAEVRIELGADLELVGAGPESLVDSYHVLEEAGRRQAVLRLTPRAIADGAYRLRLSARSSFPAGGTVELGVMRPLGSTSLGATLALAGAEDVSVSAAGREWPEGVSPLGAPPPPDWPWVDGKPASGEVQWLRLSPEVRSLAVVVAPRRLRVEQTGGIVATLDARRLELKQEIHLRVRDGVLSRLEVIVPPELEESWQLEGDAVALRERIGQEPDGSARYRLQLSRELNDALDLRLTARWSRPREAAAGVTAEQAIPWLRVRDVPAGPVHLDLEAAPGIELKPQGTGWSVPAGPAAASSLSDGGPSPRLQWNGGSDGPFPAVAFTPARPAEVPAVLISRFLLRSIESATGNIRSTGWLRVERHPGSIAVRLPPSSRVLFARSGTVALPVEHLEGSNDYRVVPPSRQPGPVMIQLAWEQPGRVGGAVVTPEFLDRAVTEQTLWEVRPPAGRVVAGVPDGWGDVNRWVFDRYHWRRQPNLTPAAEAAWLGLASPQELAGDLAARSQALLFARDGAAVPSRLLVVSRPTLVGVCSAATLVLGLLLLLLRPPARVLWLCGLAASLALAVTVEPNLGLLVAQSSALGAGLVVIAWLTDRWVQRRKARPAASRTSTSARGLPPATGSTQTPAQGPTEEEPSTVIRRRPSTTVDFVPTTGAAPSGAGE